MNADASFASILVGCRSLFSPALVDAAGWARLLRCARLLPRTVADGYFGCEFHLAEASADVDLCVVVGQDSELSRHYVRLGACAEAGSPAAALGAGLRECAAHPDAPLARAASGVLLEYDLAGLRLGAAPSHPGVFMMRRRRNQEPSAHEESSPTPADMLAAVAKMVAWDGCETMIEPLERFVEALPNALRRMSNLQMGALPGRSLQALRIVVWGVAQDDVPGLLRRVGWPGSPAAAQAVLEAAGDLAVRLALSMDLTPRGPGPRLGLELFRPSTWLDASRADWRALVTRLEQNGWSLPAKADALCHWPRVDRLLWGGEAYHVRQGINHVKVVVEPGRPTIAKGYAGMAVRARGSTRRVA